MKFLIILILINLAAAEKGSCREARKCCDGKVNFQIILNHISKPDSLKTFQEKMPIVWYKRQISTPLLKTIWTMNRAIATTVAWTQATAARTSKTIAEVSSSHVYKTWQTIEVHQKTWVPCTYVSWGSKYQSNFRRLLGRKDFLAALNCKRRQLYVFNLVVV